jgi:hypothetical protein
MSKKHTLLNPYASVYGKGNSGYTQPKQCSHPQQAIMKIGKAWIWAGPARQMEGTTEWDFRIRLTDNIFAWPNSAIVRGNEAACKILPDYITKYDTPPTLDVVWDDFSQPEMERQWWIELVEHLRLFEGNVAIYCYGGHGRTGTTLSILAALGDVTSGDPVAWVRKNYCDKAVESQAQIRYIKYVTQRRFNSSVAMYSSAYGGLGMYGEAYASEKTDTNNPSWDTVLTDEAGE